MNHEERLANWKHHPSQRNLFSLELYKKMMTNDKIVFITGDLGYATFDAQKEDFPDRFHNVGASEQFMLDFAVGLALSGKLPVVYSITPFLLYRGFETLRTYVNHEKIPVILVGGGRDYCYSHDGMSHWAHDVKPIMDNLKNIQQYWPETAEDILQAITDVVKSENPSFISLRR